MQMSTEAGDVVMQGAWERALQTVRAFEETLAAEMTTPAMKCASADRRIAFAESAHLKLIADALYLTNVAISRAIQNGVLPQDVVQELEQQAAAFTVAALSGRRFFCDAKPCEWRGTLENVGPSGFCPACRGRSLKPSPEVAQAMPPEPQQGTPRIIIP